MNSPIKYFGGKGNGLAKKIIDHFPEDSNVKTYVEPFGGSGAVLFNLEKSYPVEVYNDLEENVYSLFKVLVDKVLFNEFKKLCDIAIYSEQLNKEYKEQLRGKDLSIVERAFMFFYVNRTSYNGTGSFTSSTVVRRNMVKQVSDFLSSIDKLYDVHNRLSKVLVFNRDAVDLINKYDKKNTIMYLDPPYVQSTRTEARYKVDMDDEKHLDLINTLLDIKEAYVVLSGYDNENYGILEQYGWNKYSIQIRRNSGNLKKSVLKEECLWLNY